MQAGTITGEFWDTGNLANLSAALAAIDGIAPDVTFTSTAIDYPGGSTGSAVNSTGLAAFLGADGAGLPSTDLTGSVFRFTGTLDLASGAHSMSVGSDDGFRLLIDEALASEYSGLRGYGTTTASVTTTGPAAFDLIYFENGGYTGVEFAVDGAVVSTANTIDMAPAPVPLPAGFPLLAAAIGVGAFVGRKKR